MGDNENYYHVLGVSYDATFNEIREAFRKKVKEVHPDKEKGNAEQFTRVKEAYDVLKNSEKRKRYDDLLFRQTQQVKKEAPPTQNPTITVINLRNNHRKRISLSTVTMNAALLMIEIFKNRHFRK